jgi:DNA repair ATPase RecN
VRISAIRIRDFKRIKEISIEPEADRSLLLLGGANGQGKSSTLDALSAAFGGKKAQPTDPVRHGAESAQIVVELDGGDISITRDIAPDGSSQLEVRDRMGARKSPQTVLDKLISGRFLDPMQFMALPAKEQRAQLMRMIPDAERIAGLDEKREKAFDRRTEVGRDLTKAEGELARLPDVEVGTPIDIAALLAESKQLAEQQRQLAELKSARESCERVTSQIKQNLGSVKTEIARLRARLNELDAESAQLEADATDAEAREAEATSKVDAAIGDWDATAEHRAQIETDLTRAAEHNKAISVAEAQARRRTDVVAEVDKLRTEKETLTKLLATIDERKASILAAAQLPVPGLGVTDDGIELAGVPFTQASGAEKMRVALALAIAASPNLDDIWVRDAALLDEESLAAVEEQAKAAGKRCWLERVGDRDPGVIVIRDGKVLAS